MKPLRVLHLASFTGNIGDNANHTGTRALLKKNLSYSLAYTNLEIREFHWKNRKFDESFVTLANQYDLVLIGGGNYFELWVESSSTGTTIDLHSVLLSQINPPILFYGLGCDPYKGVTPETIQRFKDFLDYVLSSPKYMVSVRNDGSLENIHKYLGSNYAEKVFKVPDGGFFTEVNDYFHPQLRPGRRYLGINLAGDMLELRFKRDGNRDRQNHIDYETFLKLFAKLVQQHLDEAPDLAVVLVPHIFRDLAIIYDFLNQVDDSYRRQRITVAPYLNGEGSQEYIFDLYRKCTLIMGMRFHTSVCGLGLNVPTIGLVAYPKIADLYRELNIPKRAVPVNEKGFEQNLDLLLRDTLKNTAEIKKEYSLIKSQLLAEANKFHGIVDEWLKGLFD